MRKEIIPSIPSKRSMIVLEAAEYINVVETIEACHSVPEVFTAYKKLRESGFDENSALKVLLIWLISYRVNVKSAMNFDCGLSVDTP